MNHDEPTDTLAELNWALDHVLSPELEFLIEMYKAKKAWLGKDDSLSGFEKWVLLTREDLDMLINTNFHVNIKTHDAKH